MIKYNEALCMERRLAYPCTGLLDDVIIMNLKKFDFIILFIDIINL